MILLDTDHFSLLRFPDSVKGEKLKESLLQKGNPAITIITVEEQMRGWLSFIAKERTVHRQVIPYRELSRWFEFCSGFEIIPFDHQAADQFDRLRSQKVRISTFDLKIASIVLANNALLLSANLRDFQRVPGLQVQNWLDSD